MLGDAYPEVRAEAERIEQTVQGEEGRFADTLDKGLVLLEDSLAELRKTGGRSLPGDVAFRLYDTYGFPVDLTEDILRNEGIAVDHEGFERLMEEQRERGRAAKSVSATFSGGLVGSLRGTVTLGPPPSRFLGYDRLAHESRVTALYHGDTPVEEAVEGDAVELIVAETPFYAESGGQVGDRGIIRTARGDAVEVLDTQHPTPEVSIHLGRVVSGRVAAGDTVELAVDGERRQRAMLNHSATHILHAVLRERLGANVHQAARWWRRTGCGSTSLTTAPWIPRPWSASSGK